MYSSIQFVSVLKDYISNEDQLHILFRAMDDKAQNEIRWNELVNFTLHELTKEHAAEKLVCTGIFSCTRLSYPFH